MGVRYSCHRLDAVAWIVFDEVYREGNRLTEAAVAILAAAEFAAVVGKHGVDLGATLLKGCSTSLLSSWTAVRGSLSR